MLGILRGAAMSRILPTPGNHDYGVDKELPYYYLYFPNAGPIRRGYYAYDFGGWRIYALNSDLVLPELRARRATVFVNVCGTTLDEYAEVSRILSDHEGVDERVVDTDFRVRDCENLYVSDASVFPRGIRVNPQWTIMAVASAAARRIAETT